MTSLPRFERNLPGILEDLYLGPSPDYRDDLLATARRTRQRPAWSFPERWIPVDIANRLAFAPRYPARLFAVALLVLALVAAGLLWYAGTHPPIKPALPFGPARNGAVVYALGGDIYVGDSATGNSRRIVSGTEFDRYPRVSPDGTHVAFLRTSAASTEDRFDLVVASIDGSSTRILDTAKLSESDPISWAPDGSYLLVDVGSDTYRVEIDGSAPHRVAFETRIQDGAFQAPSGAQVLYESLMGARALGVMHPDGSGAHLIYTIPFAEQADNCDFGTVAWSPDGSRIAFMRRPAGTPDQCRIFVMNADGTGAHQLTTDTDVLVETDLRWSPDGTQIAFDRWNNTIGNWLVQPIGVVSANGGATRSLGPTPVSDGAAFEWSPDGTSIISAPATVLQWPPSTSMPEAPPVIIDVATGASHEAAWTLSSWPSWQRVGE